MRMWLYRYIGGSNAYYACGEVDANSKYDKACTNLLISLGSSTRSDPHYSDVIDQGSLRLLS